MPVLIGTSGWHYQHWKGGFYPAGTGSSRWLAYYADRFDTVEINNDLHGCALRNAVLFARLVTGAGRSPSAVPVGRELGTFT